MQDICYFTLNILYQMYFYMKQEGSLITVTDINYEADKAPNIWPPPPQLGAPNFVLKCMMMILISIDPDTSKSWFL